MHALWLILSEDGEHRPRQDDFTGGTDPAAVQKALHHGLGQISRALGSHGVDAAHGRPRPQPAAEVPARGDPARDPGAVARGVPGRPDGARRHDVPVGARLRRDLEPGPRRARGAGHRARGPQRGLPPGAGAGARRLARRALGPHRGDAGRGPVPGRRAGHPLRARPAGREARPARDAEALRGPLVERGRAQPRAGAPRLARAERRLPAAVRDGGEAGARRLGDAGVPRHRQRVVPRVAPPAHRGAPRGVGLRRADRGRLHRHQPPLPAPQPRRATAPRRRRWRSMPASTSSCRPTTAPRTWARRSSAGSSRWRRSTRSCKRIVTEKIRLGLFERPYVDEGAIDLQAPATVALAREVARQAHGGAREPTASCRSIPARGQRIALIGPTADDPLALLCGYSFPVHLILNDAGEAAAQVVTPAGRVRAGLWRRRVAYAQGCYIIEERKYGSPVFPGDVEKSTTLEQSSPVSRRTDLIPAAVECARGGGRRRGVRRRPGGPVPDRHRRRGLGRRLARPAGRAAAAARGGGRDRQAGGGRAHERPPLQPRRAGGQGRRVRDGLRGRPGRRTRAGRRADRQGGALGPAHRLGAEERRRRPVLLQPQDEERRHADRAALRQPLPVRPRPRLHAVRVRRPGARRAGGGRRRPARSACGSPCATPARAPGWRCRSSTCATCSPRWCGR